MKKGVFLYILLLLIAGTMLINAGHIIKTFDGGSSFTVNKSLIFTYNISVNNTDIGQNASIIGVQITLPTNLTFIVNSQGTSSFGGFTNTSTTLYWSNSTILINESQIKYFWFNANATSEGNYSISIQTSNSTGSLTSTINLTVLSVNITTPCTENWNCTEWGSCIDGNETRTCIDLNNCNTTLSKPSINRTCTICVQNWSCTQWSDCIGGIQIRACVDTNTCGNNTGKPVVNQTCEIISEESCILDWSCTSWEPEKCPKNETQTRICTDSENCGDNTGKPPETRSCTYEKSNTWIFITIIIVLFVIIAVVIAFIIKFSKQEFEEVEYSS